MPLPILICDDSSFAQKQMARAIPEEWPLVISFASDGVQALRALKEGKGEILFLDLTMPNMDGYQVLEAIKNEALTTQVIVVSGDIQPEAYRRVMQLGAMEFIKKPIDREELIRIVDKLGLLERITSYSDNRSQIANDVFDGYREIVNIAMGRAADMLARLLGCFVIMPIPKVNILEVSELRMVLEHIGDGDTVSAVCQGFIGNGIAGEALLIFNETSFKDMAELMKHQGQIDDVAQLELLMDIGSILIGAVLKGLTDQLDINFSQSHPVVLSQHGRVADLIKHGAVRWKKTLSVELGYAIEGRNINSDLLLLFTEDSVPRLSELVSYVTQ
ncbi:MAG: response regulator [Gammaproteobacteria bacterium]|nr:response regulator [Gammaproteobacteria bacterium]